MKLERFYHGTSADNLASIKRDGLTTRNGKIWNDSLNCIYMWSPKLLVELGEAERSYANHAAFQRAYESGLFTLARARNCRVVVCEIELDPKAFDVAPDDSSPNMERSGAVCTPDDIPLKFIRRIFVSSDLSLLKGYFMHMMCQRNNTNFYPTDKEEQIAKLFEKVEFYDHIYDHIDEVARPWRRIKF